MRSITCLASCLILSVVHAGHAQVGAEPPGSGATQTGTQADAPDTAGQAASDPSAAPVADAPGSDNPDTSGPPGDSDPGDGDPGDGDNGDGDNGDGDDGTSDGGDVDAASLAADGNPASLLPPSLSPVYSWRENATRLYYDSAISLQWRAEMGDYLPTVLGSATITDTNSTKVVKIPVTGNDFVLKTDNKGKAYFYSREYSNAAYRPVLVVNGTTRYQATRDTALSPSSQTPAGTSTALKEGGTILIAFDGYTPKAGDRAELWLTTYTQYTTHQTFAYAPDIWPAYPVIPFVSDPTEIARINPEDFRLEPNITVAGGIATGTIEGFVQSAFDQPFVIPSGDEYYMTGIMKLHGDWPTGRAGKLPGLSNTGSVTNRTSATLIVDGQNCNNAGWGGRPANGCRWSARTGWGGRSGDLVGLNTYFYPYGVSTDYGVVDYFPSPVKVDRWFAYVERVKLNRVGEADGQLSYWLCADTTGGVCQPQYHRANITWRNSNVPLSRISELWGIIFCGGTDCGKGPWPKSTASLKRMSVTRGLPDLTALQAEVDALNR